MEVSLELLVRSYFFSICVSVPVCVHVCVCVFASVQVAEGLAKPPLFSHPCGLTGGRKKTKRKEKKKRLTTTSLSLHFTAR